MASLPKRLLVVGYYGFGNLGDEAILSGLLAHWRAIREDLRFTVVSGDPEGTQARHGVEAVFWQDPVALDRAARRADLILIGGGGLFHDYWGFHPATVLTAEASGIAFYAGAAVLAYLYEKPLGLYAVGVGPLLTEPGRLFTRAVAAMADAVTVRDSESREELAALGLEPSRVLVTADPAFGSLSAEPAPEAEPPGAHPSEGPVVAVVLRHWDFGVSSAYWEGEVAAALDLFLGSEKVRVLFIPFQRHTGERENDLAVASRVRARMQRGDRAEILETVVSPAQAARRISRCDLVVAMRLHAGIFAARGGVPLVALSYDPKVERLMKRLGAEGFSTDIRSVDAVAFCAQMQEALAAGGEYAGRLEKEGRALGALAESTPQSMLPVLERGRAASRETSEDVRALLAHALQGQFRALESVRSRIAEQRDATDALAAELRERDDRLKAQGRELLEARDYVRSLDTERERTVSALNAEKAALEEGLAQARAQAESWKEDAARRQAEAEDWKREAERAKGTSERLQAEAEGWKKDAERARMVAADLSQTAESLRGELVSWQTSRLWRLANVYWRLLGLLRRRPSPPPRRPGSPAEEQSLAPPSDPAATPAPEVAPARESLTARVPIPDGFPSGSRGKYDVVVFSIVDWDFRFQRPQQIASQFARHGHRVLYLSTTKFLPADGPPGRLGGRSENLAELQIRSRPLDIYGGRLTEEDLDSLEASFAELAGELALGDVACMVQIPFWGPLALRLRERFGWKTLYDCMDEWTNFPGFGAEVLALEEDLVRRADLTVVSADRLEQKWKGVARRHVLARNGVDLSHYVARYGENELLGSVRRPVIGYFGALASWVDVPLLEKIARRHPEATVALAGGQFDVDLTPVSSLPNVRLLGQRPYQEMPLLLWNYDVCMIPFLVNEITEATNPVKFYEYLFGGKPVVAPDLTELRPHARLCYLANGHEEFLAQLDRALAESPDDPRRAERRRLAEANDWSVRYGEIDRALREAFPLVSVVVVTYGELALTRACLDSLLEETWPRFEVLAVDNASKDGTPEYLRSLAGRDPRVRCVLNPENTGFAAGNNRGVREARGDIVVLLNNDTVVPPGLLGRLARHLQRDPSIGLLCPTTNFCGNEARIEPEYAELEALPLFASRRAARLAGESFDIPVAAMYCAAARRSVLEEVGPLDEAFGIGMFEDDDFAVRMRAAGYRVVCAEDSYVHHVGQGSFRKLSAEDYDRLWKKNQAYFEEKWGKPWKEHTPREGVARPESKVASGASDRRMEP